MSGKTITAQHLKVAVENNAHEFLHNLFSKMYSIFNTLQITWTNEKLEIPIFARSSCTIHPFFPPNKCTKCSSRQWQAASTMFNMILINMFIWMEQKTSQCYNVRNCWLTTDFCFFYYRCPARTMSTSCD